PGFRGVLAAHGGQAALAPAPRTTPRARRDARIARQTAVPRVFVPHRARSLPGAHGGCERSASGGWRAPRGPTREPKKRGKQQQISPSVVGKCPKTPGDMTARTLKNPILPGFNPDPSIVRVGDDYYVATSTFEWFPGVQIHHSRDLVNWRLLTRPLTR